MISALADGRRWNDSGWFLTRTVYSATWLRPRGVSTGKLRTDQLVLVDFVVLGAVSGG